MLFHNSKDVEGDFALLIYIYIRITTEEGLPFLMSFYKDLEKRQG